jgi:predicted AAA+ superfamily ATPase
MTVKDMEQEIQEIWKLFRETDARLSAQFQETRALIEKISTEVGNLTGKWSKFVEGLVAPATVKLFRERGIEVTGISQRVKRQKDSDGIEIDILATNEQYVILIEAKSTLGVEDIQEHLERLGKFAAFFPEYKDRKVIGAVAGIVIDEGADKFAYRNGLFVIAQSGETVKILNDEQFRPKVW